MPLMKLRAVSSLFIIFKKIFLDFPLPLVTPYLYKYISIIKGKKINHVFGILMLVVRNFHMLIPRIRYSITE